VARVIVGISPTDTSPEIPVNRPHRIVAGFDVSQDLDAAAAGRWCWRDLPFFSVEELYAETFFQLSDVLGNARLRCMLPDRSGRKRALLVGRHKNPNVPQAFRHNFSRALLPPARERQDTLLIAHSGSGLPEGTEQSLCNHCSIWRSQASRPE
jgi:hypothetical protein